MSYTLGNKMKEHRENGKQPLYGMDDYWIHKQT